MAPVAVHMDKNNGLGQTIKALRKLRGMTQAQLAELAGVERTSITNIERGNQTLTVLTINAIAAALGYQVRVQFVLAKPTESCP
jgi:transcriptional regulator with XRE-family HTH domain